MITSKEYIINKLSIFINLFPTVRVRYEHDGNALVHIIEILPSEVYRQNEDYIAWESEMFDRFIDRYPCENVCFITDDALVGIGNADLTLYGESFTGDRQVGDSTADKRRRRTRKSVPMPVLIE
ncbi:MAG: hypothetical protein LBL94_10645 [Prevotellaceae bacterium]|jgi:hypothetical protein|nr:hypothetical protein [Prevotellaceae bacterium]